MFIFLYPLCCAAQDIERVPLTVLLTQMEKAYSVVFNRLDQDIDFYTITPPPPGLSLPKKLAYIENRTRLRFTPTDSRHYIIKNDVSPQNPLCGYLTDATTGNPIEGSQVFTNTKDPPVVTDSKGYFALPAAAPVAVQVFALGYKPLTIQPTGLYVPGCPVFTLQPDVIELEEVVAQRYIARGISRKVNGQLVVKPQEFGILPGLTEADVLQTMQQLPGISTIDETVSNINVRGGTHDQNLFLWNGIRMYQTSHFFGLISAFNPLQANTISIYKNGCPAFYDEGVSGFVNLQAIPQKDSTYTVAAADMISASLLSVIKLSEKASLQVAARRTLPFSTPTFSNYRERIYQNTIVTDVQQDIENPVYTRDDFYFYDASFSYRQAIGTRHEAVVSGIGIQNSLEVHQQAGSVNNNSSLKQRNFGGSAGLSSKWSEKASSMAEGYVSYYSLDGVNEAVENEQITTQSNTVRDAGLRLRYNQALSERVSLSGGYQLNGISITNRDRINDPEFSKTEKVISISHALIGQGSYVSANGATHITLGVRAGYFNKYKQFLPQPRLSASQRLSGTLKLELSGEMKSQATSQIIDLQQDFLGIEKRRWVLANGDIPLQKSTQAQAGLTYSDKGWYASAECFYKKITGINSKSQAFRNQFEFVYSTGNYRVLGCEVLIQKQTRHFYNWLSYSYNDNQYDFEGYTPPVFTNNFAVSHAVASAAMYEANNFKVALGAKWRTGTPVTEPLSYSIDPDNPANSQVTYKSPNSSVLKDYFSINLSLSKTWQLKKMQLTAGASVQNITNRKNTINRHYRINVNNNTLESINTYGLGRTPNLSVKVAF